MFVVDTNVLLYSANSDAVEHVVCREHGIEVIYSRDRFDVRCSEFDVPT